MAKSIIIIIALSISLLLVSCNNKPTLQQYFVKNQSEKNFISMDVSPDILKIDKSKLSVEEAKAMASFDKMNVLAFKTNSKNKASYQLEKDKVVEILKDTAEYHQLMKFGSGGAGASISFVGDENHINEFVLFGNKKENGFAVVRILGNDMKPENAMQLLSILQKSNINGKDLSVFEDMIK